MKKVSILVPIYGVEKYIEKCARSLFEQTYGEIEYVFVDDCTPDNSLGILMDVLNDYPDRKKYVNIVRHETNKGLAVARKTATLAATGDFIIHIDSDDYIDNNAIELMMQEAEKENADMVVSHMLWVFEDGNTRFVNCNFHPQKMEYVKLMLKRKAIFCLAGKLLKRSVITNNNLFAQEGINQGEDYVIVPIITYHCDKVSCVNKALYKYVRYNTSAYTANFDDKAIANIVEANNILGRFFLSSTENEEFKETIELSKLYTKVTLVSASSRDSYPQIASIYEEIPFMHASIELRYKILLILLKLHLWCLLYFLVNSFKKRNK